MIQEIILFVATYSQSSQPCTSFVQQHKIPVSCIRLDTEEMREKAANGKHFQITHVPTLVVIYQDGNIQLFMSKDKIIAWLQGLIKSQRRPQQRQPSHTDNMYQEEPTEMRNVKFIPVAKNIQKKRPVVIDYDDEEQGEVQEEVPEEEPAVEEILEQSPEEQSEVQEEQSEEQIEEEVKPKKKKKGTVKTKVEKAPPKTKIKVTGKSTGPPSRMKGILDAAKQMEMDMKGSLGYKEEDLPKF